MADTLEYATGKEKNKIKTATEAFKETEKIYSNTRGLLRVLAALPVKTFTSEWFFFNSEENLNQI